MVIITEGVEFDTVAREWRMKWSGDDDKKSLQEAQKALVNILDEVKKLDGVKSVSSDHDQRIHVGTKLLSLKIDLHAYFKCLGTTCGMWWMLGL